ncbi:hypothetical protein M1L60_07560 [Actinoplanes sp. TRM 88003]|uniref:HEAT repeat domain-containing protein n=1 Tax=Paractinoplanes aksuensis TaxID=2939490 RepID=A0ABT1DHZ3_9ACTN|nr:hypothetical protein [Actinoplanes aksuensis]MCO8270451.1 hypothetical protein [Actinoplanes aksuensis]
MPGDVVIPDSYSDLWGADRGRQNAAYESLMATTEQSVPWAGAVWDDVVGHLADRDNHNRAIAGQLLCNLAAHESSDRVLGDLPALIVVTKDPRFVTARHTLRSLWKIGLAGEKQRAGLLETLRVRYRDSFDEKNGTLVRSDLVESLRRLHDAVPDEAVSELAQEFIAAEPEEKYRKKYAKFWR